MFVNRDTIYYSIGPFIKSLNEKGKNILSFYSNST